MEDVQKLNKCYRYSGTPTAKYFCQYVYMQEINLVNMDGMEVFLFKLGCNTLIHQPAIYTTHKPSLKIL